MVEAEEVKEGRVQIVNVHGVVGDVEAEVVGFAMDVAAFEASTG